MKATDLSFDLSETTDPTANNDSASEGVFLGEVDARVLDRFATGHHGKIA